MDQHKQKMKLVGRAIMAKNGAGENNVENVVSMEAIHDIEEAGVDSKEIMEAIQDTRMLMWSLDRVKATHR